MVQSKFEGLGALEIEGEGARHRPLQFKRCVHNCTRNPKVQSLKQC